MGYYRPQYFFRYLAASLPHPPPNQSIFCFAKISQPQLCNRTLKMVKYYFQRRSVVDSLSEPENFRKRKKEMKLYIKMNKYFKNIARPPPIPMLESRSKTPVLWDCFLATLRSPSLPPFSHIPHFSFAQALFPAATDVTQHRITAPTYLSSERMMT